MASDDPCDANDGHLGDVTDSDGNVVSVFTDVDGTVIIEHVMGSVELCAEARDELRELLDRAAMPGVVADATS